METDLTLPLAGYFSSNLVLTTKTAVPAHQRANARAGGSGGGQWWKAAHGSRRAWSWSGLLCPPPLASDLVANLRVKLTPSPKAQAAFLCPVTHFGGASAVLGCVCAQGSPMAFPATWKEDKTLWITVPHKKICICSIWQGAAVKQLQFSSGVFYFLSTPSACGQCACRRSSGLFFSLSETKPLLQGLWGWGWCWVHRKLLLRQETPRMIRGSCLIWCPLMPVQGEAVCSMATEYCFRQCLKAICLPSLWHPVPAASHSVRSAVTHFDTPVVAEGPWLLHESLHCTVWHLLITWVPRTTLDLWPWLCFWALRLRPSPRCAVAAHPTRLHEDQHSQPGAGADLHPSGSKCTQIISPLRGTGIPSRQLKEERQQALSQENNMPGHWSVSSEVISRGSHFILCLIFQDPWNDLFLHLIS